MQLILQFYWQVQQQFGDWNFHFFFCLKTSLVIMKLPLCIAFHIQYLFSSQRRNEWFCPSCGSKADVHTVVCESCLEWFHLDCVNLKQKPKIADWFCNHCKSSFKKYGDSFLINEKGKFCIHCSSKVWQHQRSRCVRFIFPTIHFHISVIYPDQLLPAAVVNENETRLLWETLRRTSYNFTDLESFQKPFFAISQNIWHLSRLNHSKKNPEVFYYNVITHRWIILANC